VAGLTLEETALRSREVGTRRGPSGPHHAPRAASRGRSRAALWLALGAYLLLAVLWWWQVWTRSPSSTTLCGCGDASLFQWYVEWPAYALTHGRDLFYSTALFHPTGTNLLSNTSVLALSLPLVPVTLVFGPVASINVALTLAPALTAWATFFVVRRWVRWEPASFIAGLVFGFGPFVLVNLAGAHLMLGLLALVPVMAGCLDELLVRQQRSPYTVGALLAVVISVQYFVGTEMLAICGVSALAGIVLLVVYGAVARRGELVSRAPHAARGLGIAVAGAAVLLAYPVWFTFAGPAHLSGLVWPGLSASTGGARWGNIWYPHYQVALAHAMRISGGYLGPPLPEAEYLGLGALVVVAAGCLLWRRDRRLWFFVALGAITLTTSLGIAVPWSVLGHLPVVQNILPGRFAAITALCVAVALAVIVDHVRDTMRALTRRHVAARTAQGRRLSRPLVWVAPLVALGVAAVAVVPMASAEASNVPLTSRSVKLPAWFAHAGARVPPGSVVLAYPAPFTLVESAMTWQAVDRMRFAMAGGSGPGGTASRAGAERPGFEVIQGFSFPFFGPPAATSRNVMAVRQALAGWRVTTVVVPDPVGLPRYDRGTDPAAALGFFTAAVGRPPAYEDRAWVWSNVGHPSPARALSPAAFQRCTTLDVDQAPRAAIPDCVMRVSTS
jgi:hypothetical protein